MESAFMEYHVTGYEIFFFFEGHITSKLSFQLDIQETHKLVLEVQICMRMRQSRSKG